MRVAEFINHHLSSFPSKLKIVKPGLVQQSVDSTKLDLTREERSIVKPIIIVKENINIFERCTVTVSSEDK